MMQDGYCDTCGLAEPRAAAAPAPRPAATRAPVPSSRPAPAPAPAPAPSAGANGSYDPASSSARTGTGRSSTGRTSTGRTRGSALSARTGASGRTTATTGRGSRSTGRGGLGLGLVEIPQVEYRDPAEAILTNPEVPERKRYCSKCSAPVGRSRDGRPGRISGFCAKCGGGYDFAPKLVAGDLIAGQYEVLGCLAHGGLGWIYLARDNNVSGRWVALKGLLDTGDADALAAAVAERQFLAEVEHPSVVKIYNFVNHRSGDYIVMEYVGGKSLKQIALEYKEQHSSSPLPLEQVLAYAIEILPAFGYLHSIGLLYCDFKPDNIIQSEEQLKLIDLGAVRAFDDDDSAVYGTVGYQAAEIAEDGPTIESDLFTVGRMMAVLSFDFKGYTSSFATTLPERSSVPLLTKFESFDRALRRATHERRERRFSSAAEMGGQLTGVLREVLAVGDGQPRPAVSMLLSAERAAVGSDLAAPNPAQFVAALPIPAVDPSDPAAGLLATVGGTPRQVIATLKALPSQTTEVKYRRVRAMIEAGAYLEAQQGLDALKAEDPYDWRVIYYRGLCALAMGEARSARLEFEDCYSELPGELAPKLALAAAAELAGWPDEAMTYYKLVWTVDRSYASAAFGLARLRLARGDHAGAVEVLGQVPESSIHRTAAEIAAITTRLSSPDFAKWATAQELVLLGDRVQALGLDGEAHEALVCKVLTGALNWEGEHPDEVQGLFLQGSAVPKVLSTGLRGRELRLALERSYRARARMAPDRKTRVVLVDQANSVRPRTLV
jgi:serine/threonine-protein kinase PknG